MNTAPTFWFDSHIHIESRGEVKTLLRAMDNIGVLKCILMGASRFTITLRTCDGFTRYEENNREILEAQRDFPDRFAAFPTLDPIAADNSARLQRYLHAGASGLKLYVGHAYTFGNPQRYMFHVTPIDGSAMRPIYDLCARENIPICLHVNTTDRAPGFRDEFEGVLREYPELCMIAPHWMLAVRRPTYLRRMLKMHPNLCFDVSFGQDDFLAVGLKNISANRDRLRTIVCDFADRVLCGSDIVCTSARHKTSEWMATRISVYRRMLEDDSFQCPITGELRLGLHLPLTVLQNVLIDNPLRILNQRQASRSLRVRC
jgi:predicted TIM-barrel fold metal-dependent hydrolase